MTQHEVIVTPLTTVRVHANQAEQTVSVYIGQTELVFPDSHTCSRTVIALCQAGEYLSRMSPPPPPSRKDREQRRRLTIV